MSTMPPATALKRLTNEERNEFMKMDSGPIQLWYRTAPFGADERNGLPVALLRGPFEFPKMIDALSQILQGDGQHDFHEPYLTTVEGSLVAYPGEQAALLQHARKIKNDAQASPAAGA